PGSPLLLSSDHAWLMYPFVLVDKQSCSGMDKLRRAIENRFSVGVSVADTGGRRMAMPIGASLFLIVVGAILYFATNFHVAHIDIDVGGLILMLAGVAGLILGFVQLSYWRRGRREVLVDERRDPREPVEPRRDPRY